MQLKHLLPAILLRALSIPAMLTIGLLAGSGLNAADNPYLMIEGIYTGEVYNGEDMDPVVTTFVIEPSGRLSGNYRVEEENGAYSGTLSNIVFDDARSVSMEWTDKFGEGFAFMEFAPGFASFTGAWTNKEGENALPWSGKK